MKKPTDFGQPAPDPYPNKAAEPFRLRLLALTDAKLTHGAARLYCLLLEWSYLLIKGGDGHGKVETTTRAISAAMGCNRYYVTKWQRVLKARKYVLVDLVACGRGLNRFCFSIVGLYQEPAPEVGPVDGKTTGCTTASNKGSTTASNKGSTTASNKGSTTASTIRRRQETGRQETSSTENLKNTEYSYPVDQLKCSSAQVSQASPEGKKRTTQRLREFLAAMEKLTGKPAMAQWGGWWTNRFREKPGKCERALADVRAEIREGKKIDDPGAYARTLFDLFHD